MPRSSRTKRKTRSKVGKPASDSAPDDRRVVELLHGCLLLHQEAITVVDWLQLFASATGSDGVATFRWIAGKPESGLMACYGDIAELTAGSRTWIDRIVAQSSPGAPAFADELQAASIGPAIPAPALFIDPRYLIGVVDWSPACLALVMARSLARPEWSAADREHIRAILPYVRAAVLVHRKLDSNERIIEMARVLLNKSPRGILLVSEGGVIQLANSMAATMLAANDGIAVQAGKLTIHCKVAAERVASYLRKLFSASSEQLANVEDNVNVVVEKRSRRLPYQLQLSYLQLDNRQLSRHSDRVAVIYLADPTIHNRLDPERLREFYGFTKSQARLAAELFNGHSINGAAEALHVSVNTARTHLRGIYAKVGVKTQSELLGMLSSGLKNFGDDIVRR